MQAPYLDRSPIGPARHKYIGLDYSAKDIPPASSLSCNCFSLIFSIGILYTELRIV